MGFYKILCVCPRTTHEALLPHLLLLLATIPLAVQVLCTPVRLYEALFYTSVITRSGTAVE